MSDAVVIALIGAIPATIGAYAALLEARAKRHDTQQRREADTASTSAPTPAGEARAGVPARPPPRNPLRLVVIVVGALLVTVTVVFAAAVVLDGDDDRGTVGPVDDVVAVAGDRGWTDTGIDVEADELVLITATGEVVHSTEKDEKSGPDGKPNTGDYPTNVIPGVDHNRLIGRIGISDPFSVGAAYEFAAALDGRLWLRVNDAGVNNNSGQFDVHVRLPNRPGA